MSYSCSQWGQMNLSHSEKQFWVIPFIPYIFMSISHTQGTEAGDRPAKMYQDFRVGILSLPDHRGSGVPKSKPTCLSDSLQEFQKVQFLFLFHSNAHESELPGIRSESPSEDCVLNLNMPCRAALRGLLSTEGGGGTAVGCTLLAGTRG